MYDFPPYNGECTVLIGKETTSFPPKWDGTKYKLSFRGVWKNCTFTSGRNVHISALGASDTVSLFWRTYGLSHKIIYSHLHFQEDWNQWKLRNTSGEAFSYPKFSPHGCFKRRATPQTNLQHLADYPLVFILAYTFIRSHRNGKLQCWTSYNVRWFRKILRSH